MYQYEMEVIRWIDGDTVEAQVSLGFHVSLDVRFRILNLDTPERGEPGYLEAKELAEKTFPVGSKHIVETYKTDKYGRWLVALPTLVTEMNQQKLNKLNLPI